MVGVFLIVGGHRPQAAAVPGANEAAGGHGEAVRAGAGRVVVDLSE